MSGLKLEANYAVDFPRKISVKFVNLRQSAGCICLSKIDIGIPIAECLVIRHRDVCKLNHKIQEICFTDGLCSFRRNEREIVEHLQGGPTKTVLVNGYEDVFVTSNC